MLADPRGRLVRTVKGDLKDPSSLTVVPGSADLAVVSTRAGQPEAWIAPLAGGGAPRALALGDLTPREVAVSGDGTRFVVSVPGRGLVVGSLSGPPSPRPLTHDGTDSAPAFATDGSRVLFTRHTASIQARVMSVPTDGSAPPSPLLEEGSDRAAPSPIDGRVAYLAGAVPTESVPTLWDPDGDLRRPLAPSLPPGNYGDLAFSPDGRKVVLVRGETELVEVDLATGAVSRTLSTPSHDQLQHPAYTPSGLVAIRVVFKGNVWLADASFGN